jgi:hypothetical protein
MPVVGAVHSINSGHFDLAIGFLAILNVIRQSFLGSCRIRTAKLFI